MISIRLAEAELHQVKQCCSQSGNLSVSEFIRTAVVQALQRNQHRPATLESHAAQIQHRLEKLENRIAELTKALDQSLNRSVADFELADTSLATPQTD
jgi:hypothetical protein